MAVLLDNTNVKFRQKMTGDYKRLLQNFDERLELKGWGLTHVVSSFISGIGEKNGDLFIRFHNGAHYQYFGFGDHFRPMMNANSKGQYFWRHIRKTTRYAKIGALNFTNGNLTDQTDKELFTNLDDENVLKMFENIDGEILKSMVLINGIEFIKYVLGELTFLLPII